MSSQQILRDNDAIVRKMKSAGHTSYEIADVLGIESPDAVRHYCYVNEIKLDGGKGSILRNDVDDVAIKIREISDGLLEYISGYETKDSPIRVKCSKCGGEFVRTFHHLTTHKPIICPGCHKLERERAAAKIEAEREHRREERKKRIELRKAETERKRLERLIPHPCPVCGTMTTRLKYCSDDCRIKANNKSKESRRRVKIKNATIDKDITVKGLFLRDCGVCAICGEPCDFNDYIVKDGFTVCGNNYPSIDHIIPLAKGGQHSWDNVQLAHRLCNSIKHDRIYG